MSHFKVGDRVVAMDGTHGTVESDEGVYPLVKWDIGITTDPNPVFLKREAIDWNAPLEAYHPDGRVVAVELEKGVTGPDVDGHWEINGDEIGEHFFDADGTGGDWRIRNRRTEPVAPAVSPELVDRMVRLVRDLAATPIGGRMPDGSHAAARAIVSDLPSEPVDPLLLKAREIAAELSRCSHLAPDYVAGKKDDSLLMRGILAGMRESQ